MTDLERQGPPPKSAATRFCVLCGHPRVHPDDPRPVATCQPCDRMWVKRNGECPDNGWSPPVAGGRLF